MRLEEDMRPASRRRYLGSYRSGGFGRVDSLGGALVDDLGDGFPDRLGNPVRHYTALLMMLLRRVRPLRVRVVVPVRLGEDN